MGHCTSSDRTETRTFSQDPGRVLCAKVDSRTNTPGGIDLIDVRRKGKLWVSYLVGREFVANLRLPTSARVKSVMDLRPSGGRI